MYFFKLIRKLPRIGLCASASQAGGATDGTVLSHQIYIAPGIHEHAPQKLEQS